VELGGTCFTIDNKEFILGSFRDISDRKESEKKIHDKNIALGKLIKLIEEEKNQIKTDFSMEVRLNVLPALDKAISGDKAAPTFIKHARESLKKFVTDDKKRLEILQRLTPREYEICDMIQNGASSKEIADALNVSTITISKHRENIRKKLDVPRGVNLIEFLRKVDNQ
jgi:DNA-binding CsgD family transcriptional regulator